MMLPISRKHKDKLNLYKLLTISSRQGLVKNTPKLRRSKTRKIRRNKKLKLKLKLRPMLKLKLNKRDNLVLLEMLFLKSKQRLTTTSQENLMILLVQMIWTILLLKLDFLIHKSLMLNVPFQISLVPWLRLLLLPRKPKKFRLR
jgi:hypothetical protein